MPTTLPNLSIVLPTVGGSTGTWATELNTALGLIDEHDHQVGRGKRIKPAAMEINADLPFGGNALTGLGQLAFSEITALADGSTILYVDDVSHELMWRTAAGVNVRLTSGASINTTLVGGIVGDYTSVDAEVAYDDANSRYTFKSPGTPKTWAVLASGEVRIYETGTSVSAYVGLKSPGSLAASYSLTWPDELPASTLAMQVDSSGNVTASNTFAQSMTLASDKMITLSGLGRVKHGQYSKTQAFQPTYVAAGAMSTAADATGIGDFSLALADPSTTCYAEIKGIEASEIIDSVVVYSSGATDSAGDCGYALYFCRPTSGNGLTAVTGATASSSDTSVVITPTSPITVAAGDQLFVRVVTPASGAYAFYSIQPRYTE